MVGSLALARILIGLAQEIFGTQVVRYPDNALATAAVGFLGARLQLLQIVGIAAALAMMLALAALLRFTNLGRGIRTVASSESVARPVGVPVERIRLATFFISGALAGGAGVLWSLLFKSASPFMGDSILLKGLTVLILGGLGNIPGGLLDILLRLPGRTHSERRRRERAFAVLEKAGVSRHADAPAGDLSYGDRRRVEIARALALGQRLLLLDEPAAGMADDVVLTTTPDWSRRGGLGRRPPPRGRNRRS